MDFKPRHDGAQHALRRDSWSRKFGGIRLTNPFVSDEFLLPQPSERAG
jgi:hypothetical protein